MHTIERSQYCSTTYHNAINIVLNSEWLQETPWKSKIKIKLLIHTWPHTIKDFNPFNEISFTASHIKRKILLYPYRTNDSSYSWLKIWRYFLRFFLAVSQRARAKKRRISGRYRFNRVQKLTCASRGSRPLPDSNARFPFSGNKSKCRRFDRTFAHFYPPSLDPFTVFYVREKVNNDRSKYLSATGDIKSLGLKNIPTTTFSLPLSFLFPRPRIPGCGHGENLGNYVELNSLKFIREGGAVWHTEGVGDGGCGTSFGYLLPR